jgi:hypothetical protein
VRPHTQQQQPVAMQLTSITGIAGVTFLIVWRIGRQPHGSTRMEAIVPVSPSIGVLGPVMPVESPARATSGEIAAIRVAAVTTPRNIFARGDARAEGRLDEE